MKKILKNILTFLKLINFSKKIYILLLQLVNYPKWVILKKREKIFLEIGSGNKKGINGWVTVDLLTKSDIVHDLKRGIPLPKNSVDQIYASHVFEHISFKDLIILLDEIYRVLKKMENFPFVFLMQVFISNLMLIKRCFNLREDFINPQ